MIPSARPTVPPQFIIIFTRRLFVCDILKCGSNVRVNGNMAKIIITITMWVGRVDQLFFTPPPSFFYLFLSILAPLLQFSNSYALRQKFSFPDPSSTLSIIRICRLPLYVEGSACEFHGPLGKRGRSFTLLYLTQFSLSELGISVFLQAKKLARTSNDGVLRYTWYNEKQTF